MMKTKKLKCAAWVHPAMDLARMHRTSVTLVGIARA